MKEAKMSHENCSEEPEKQEEARDPEDRNNKDVKVKEFLKSQSEKRTISPLTLLKEDLSQFKEEVMKVFKDKDTNPRTSQSGDKPINPLTLLKEDFNHFKEDLSSVFKIGLSKERDNKEVAAKEDSCNTSTARTAKPERAEEPLRSPFRGDQSAPKRAEEPLRSPFRGDQSAPKRAEEPLRSPFRGDQSAPKRAEEPLRSPFRGDQTAPKRAEEPLRSPFRGDQTAPKRAEEPLRSPFRGDQSAPKRAEEPLRSPFRGDQSALKTSQSAPKRAEEPLRSPFRGDQSALKTSQSAPKRAEEPLRSPFRGDQSALKTSQSAPKRAEEPLRSPFRGDQSALKTSQSAPKRAEEAENDFREVNQEMDNRDNRGDGPELELDASEENTEWKRIAEKQQSQSTAEFHGFSACLSAAEPKREPEHRREESPVGSREAPPSSGIVLLSLRDDLRNRSAGDLWSLKNFASYLTFDPDTANSELHLSEGNRRATRTWEEYRTSEHTERFRRCPQVLCREGLLDSVYWEVVWYRGADIGVTYNSISRDGDAQSCLLGHNDQSWSLECSEGGYTPCHNGKRFKSAAPKPFTHRVGVYLNWPAGSLSFYGVSEDEMVHLHTFTSTFTQPLYPGFWVWAYDGSVALCQVELGWERLLQ